LKDEVKQILDLIAAYDAVLSGGHLHSQRDVAAVRGGQGARRHAHARQPSHLRHRRQRRDVADLARMGVWIEHSFCMFINEPYSKFFTGQDLKELITAAGVDRTILGSDLGQINNPGRWRASVRDPAVPGLGYSKDEIRKMISLNACSLMGMAPPAAAGERV
jgi:hypothetical protein